MIEFITIFQINNVPIYHRLMKTETFSYSKEFNSQELKLLNSDTVLLSSSNVSGAYELEITGLIPTSASYQAKQIVNLLTSWRQTPCDVIGFMDLNTDVLPDHDNVLGHIDIPLLWLHTKGIINSVQIDEEGGGNLSISISIKIRPQWEPLNRIEWKYGYETNPFEKKRIKTFFETVPNLYTYVTDGLNPYVDYEDIQHNNNTMWHFQNIEGYTFIEYLIGPGILIERESPYFMNWRYYFTMFYILSNFLPEGMIPISHYHDYTMVPKKNEETNNPLFHTHTVFIDPTIWNTNPSVFYAVRLGINDGTDEPESDIFQLRIERQINPWKTEEEYVTVDLDAINQQIIDMGLERSVGDEDYLLFGTDIDGSNTAILRNPFDPEIITQSVSISYTSETPGQLNPGANKIVIRTPRTNTNIRFHMFVNFRMV